MEQNKQLELFPSDKKIKSETVSKKESFMKIDDKFLSELTKERASNMLIPHEKRKYGNK